MTLLVWECESPLHSVPDREAIETSPYWRNVALEEYVPLLAQLRKSFTRLLEIRIRFSTRLIGGMGAAASPRFSAIFPRRH